MKKAYQKPTLATQLFAANEYVAGCGTSGKVYHFQCDAVSNSHLGEGGKVWLESGAEPGLQTWGPNMDEYRSLYHPCHEKHDAPAIEGHFKKGYLTNYLNGDPIEVMIWTGLNDDNTHCTTRLNMEEWETTKS